jgi:hypothetical protein
VAALGATFVFVVAWVQTLNLPLAALAAITGDPMEVTLMSADEIEARRSSFADLARQIPPEHHDDVGRAFTPDAFHKALDKGMARMAGRDPDQLEEDLARMLPLLDAAVRDESIDEMAKLYGMQAKEGVPADMAVAVPVDARKVQQGTETLYHITYGDDRGGRTVVVRKKDELTEEEAAFVRLHAVIGVSGKARKLFAAIIGPKLAGQRRQAAEREAKKDRVFKRAMALLKEYRNVPGAAKEPGRHFRWFMDLATALEDGAAEAALAALASRADAPPSARTFIDRLPKTKTATAAP